MVGGAAAAAAAEEEEEDVAAETDGDAAADEDDVVAALVLTAAAAAAALPDADGATLGEADVETFDGEAAAERSWLLSVAAPDRIGSFSAPHSDDGEELEEVVAEGGCRTVATVPAVGAGEAAAEATVAGETAEADGGARPPPAPSAGADADGAAVAWAPMSNTS